MDLNNVVKNIIKDVKVDLTQEFDRNFERKAFFNKRWPSTNYPNSRGSLLLRNGRLRSSINSKASDSKIRWESNLPYATIHNEGGEITITKKMKSFFWAMFYKVSNGSKSGGKGRRQKLTAEAAKWKAMALQPIGKKIKIEQRQFIGYHPVLDTRVEKIVNHNMDQFNKEILKKLENGTNNK